MNNPVAAIEFSDSQIDMFLDVSEITEPPFERFKDEYTKQEVEALNRHIGIGIEAEVLADRKIEAVELMNWLAEIIEELEEFSNE